MKKRKIIVSFSGIDSSGKTTYINKLKNYYDENNIKYKYIWSRGGYTSIFEFLKKVVRFFMRKKLPPSGISEERSKMFEKKRVSSMWYFIAMLDLIRLYSITIPFYKLIGYNVILDRYIWDTKIDFKFMFPNKKKSFLWRLLEVFYKKPHVSIIYYITAETSLQRSIEKEEPFSEPLDKRIERIKYYDELIEQNKWNHVIETENISIDEVWEETLCIIKNKIFSK